LIDPVAIDDEQMEVFREKEKFILKVFKSSFTDMIVDMKVDFDAKVENVVDCDAFYLINKKDQLV
jgi:hypothetical protein